MSSDPRSPSSDQRVRDALDDALGPAQPSASMDRAIRRYARGRAAGDWAQSPWLIWPFSAAAATLLAVGLVALMQGLIAQPEAGPAVARAVMTPDRERDLPARPPVTGDAASATLIVSGSLMHQGLPLSIELADREDVARVRTRLAGMGAERGVNRMLELADASPLRDRELLTHYVAFRALWPESRIPAPLEQTIAEAIERRMLAADPGSP